MNNRVVEFLVNGCQIITPVQYSYSALILYNSSNLCWELILLAETRCECFNHFLIMGHRLSLLYLHCAEAGHDGSKLVKEEAAAERQEIVHKGGDGENQRELFILPAAVCWCIQNRGRHWHCTSLHKVRVQDSSGRDKATRYLGSSGGEGMTLT